MYKPLTTNTSWGEEEIVALLYINEFREQNNLEPFIADDMLQFMAEERAEDISIIWEGGPPHDHRGIDALFKKGRSKGIALSENLGWGFRSPLGVFKAWEASDGHKHVMLSPNKWAGIGIFEANNRKYWILLVGKQLK